MTAVTRRRTARRPDPRSVVGGGRDLEILADLAWAGVLSTGQLLALHFRARRRAQRRLRELFDHGLIRAHLQGEALERENVYTLSPQGLELLVERGAFPDGPPPLGRVPAPGKLRHALLARQVFVTLRRAHLSGALTLDDFRFEGELAREPSFRAHALIPDALALVRVDARSETWAIEVDAGTETTTVLRAKFDKYARAFAAAQGLFASPALSLVVLAPRTGRAQTLASVVAAAGLGARTRVLLVDAFGASIGADRAQGPGAPPGRTERPAALAEGASPQGESRADTAAFRPRGAGSRHE